MSFRKKTIRDIDVNGKVVLVRVDYNVPMQNGVITEDMRIRSSLPTLQYLKEQGSQKIILISHLGRPDGEAKPEFSLAPAAQKLAELLPNETVKFVDACYGEKVQAAVSELPTGGILMLENLRFFPDEEADSVEFAQQIIASTGAEIFVQDGFAVIHRAHASTDAIAKQLPAVAGFLVEKEVTSLEGAITNPEHPLLVIIGGAKVADKEPMIATFLPIADMIAVGGKIAADGYQSQDGKVYVAQDFATDENGVKLDIGSDSITEIVHMVSQAKTIVWNGTLGMVEDPRFAAGSLEVAKAMGHSQATTIIGGGDTAGFVEGLAAQDDSLKYSLISTGGGASLELLSGKKLPGLEVLQDN